jgi:hypothetical protein
MLMTMTMPDERTRALIFAGELLADLSNPAKTPGVPDSVRERARHVLRHYPDQGYIRDIAEQAERGALSGPLLDGAAARRR